MQKLTVSNRLTEARGERTRREVAEELKIPYSTMRAYEKGWRRPPDDVKIRLAEYYHLTVQDLFY